MTTPYASVIVPTHDRDATLDLALASIQAQTRSDIEIIVAMDGATDLVRTLANKLAEDDPRIVVRDMPKAPGYGPLNRGAAVKAARAPRIFYCDDDDLWLPDHIASLGPVLDRADIVYSPALSVSLSQALQLRLVNYEHRTPRSLLAEGMMALIYDTHLAHRKNAYEALGDPWATVGGRAVANMLAAFASSPNSTWAALSHPTGLSFHGAARTHRTDHQRRTELLHWQRKLETGSGGLLQQARVEWYLLRSFRDLPPDQTGNVEDYFRKLGIALSDNESDGLLRWTFTADQMGYLDATLALYRGAATDDAFLREVLPHLLDPLNGSRPPVRRIAAQLEKSFGFKKAMSIAMELSGTDAHARELYTLLQAVFLRRSKRWAESLSLLGTIDPHDAFYPVALMLFLSQGHAAAGNNPQSLHFARLARDLAPAAADTEIQLARAMAASDGI